MPYYKFATDIILCLKIRFAFTLDGLLGIFRMV